jgi:beta-mannosidase
LQKKLTAKAAMLYAKVVKYSFSLTVIIVFNHLLRSFAHDFALLCGYTFCAFARNINIYFMQTKIRWSLFFAMLAVSVMCLSCKKTTEKMGVTMIIETNWQFSEAGKNEWLTAMVPGTVHNDLMAHGKIPDPFFRMNESDVQWVEKTDWEYKTIFAVGKDLLQHEVILIDFKGLDTYADVYLNGNLILQANNMFVGWEIECKQFLREGDNELLIYFHSAVAKGMEKLTQLDYIIHSTNEQAPADKRTSVFTRKAPFHYGWDWGPRLVTAGVWRPIELRAWSRATIEDVYLETTSASNDKAEIIAETGIQVDQPGKYAISLFFNNRKVAGTKQIDLAKGPQNIRVGFTIDDPQLWWTNGLGSPYLYDARFELKHNGQVISTHELKYGVRTVKLNQEPDETGRSFLFELNGIPVFMKGANIIPSETLTPAVTEETYHKLINSAVDANMNMLRVWGGAIYEEDLFYHLCDENGLLVWQDFMFACNLQPGDEDHLENIRREAEYNVKRLRNHPSIAIWCGNNENLGGWHHWGWKESFEPEIREFMWRTYERIFYEILPQAVKQFDPKTPYWSSSPSAYGDQLADRKSGDEHDWTIWFGQKPFEAFHENVPRFVSEWGLQAFPSMHTISSFSEENDWDINSEVMRHRQRSKMAWVQPGFDGNDMIKHYMEMYYNVPDNFEDFTYVSQLLQAKGYRTAIEAHRRAMPHCMGSLYWQLNDCWPTISWASVDYYYRWKASHYAVKNAFEEVILSALEEQEHVAVYVVSDKLDDIPAQLHIQLIDFDGQVHYEHNTRSRCSGQYQYLSCMKLRKVNCLIWEPSVISS